MTFRQKKSSYKRLFIAFAFVTVEKFDDAKLSDTSWKDLTKVKSHVPKLPAAIRCLQKIHLFRQTTYTLDVTNINKKIYKN